MRFASSSPRKVSASGFQPTTAGVGRGDCGPDSPSKLRAKLETGATQAERGELIDGVQVFDELREMIEERRLAKAAKR